MQNALLWSFEKKAVCGWFFCLWNLFFQQDGNDLVNLYICWIGCVTTIVQRGGLAGWLLINQSKILFSPVALKIYVIIVVLPKKYVSKTTDQKNCHDTNHSQLVQWKSSKFEHTIMYIFVARICQPGGREREIGWLLLLLLSLVWACLPKVW